MAKKPLAVTKAELLAAHKAVAKQKLAPLPNKFKPGRGLKEVARAVGLAAVPCEPKQIFLPLAQTLVETEPFMQKLPHQTLEPLFDAARVVAKFPVAPAKIASPIEEDMCTVRHGDVSVTGDLEIRGILVITGSLRVSGRIYAGGDNWQSGTLVVLGDVDAASLVALGPIVIGGALTLSQGLISSHYHDTETTLIARTIEAPIWLNLGDDDVRVFGARGVPIQREPWLHARLPKYFDDGQNTGAWTIFDAKFFRAVTVARDAEQGLAKKKSAAKKKPRR